MRGFYLCAVIFCVGLSVASRRMMALAVLLHQSLRWCQWVMWRLLLPPMFPCVVCRVGNLRFLTISFQFLCGPFPSQKQKQKQKQKNVFITAQGACPKTESIFPEQSCHTQNTPAQKPARPATHTEPNGDCGTIPTMRRGTVRGSLF